MLETGHDGGHVLLPVDDPEKLATLHTIGPFFVILAVVWAFYFLRKDLFPDKSVNYIALAGFTFSVTSISMHTLNKVVVSFTRQPSLITCIQMVIAVAVLLTWYFKEVLTADRNQMMKWCIVPVAYAAMLNSSLFGYEYLSLSLVTVFRNMAPVVTIAVERVIMPVEFQPVVNAPILFSLLVMIIGALLFSWTDGAFSWIGLGLVTLNTLLAIADRVLQRRLLVKECQTLPLSACMVINNSLGVIPSLALAAASKEFSSFQDSSAQWHDPGIILLIIMSGFMGLFIGLSGLMCQKAMSATSFQVLQNMSKVVVVSIGVSIFGDKIDNAYKVCGMLLSLAGSMAYGYARTLEMPAAKKAELSPLVKGDDISHKA